MSKRTVAFITWVAPALLLMACGGSGSALIQDSGTDGSTDTDVDTDTDADTDTDTSTGELPPAGESEACWNDFFSQDHPNFGSADCEQGYLCIGDENEAWCTSSCQGSLTGDINDSGSVIDGWCCGELTNPCDPDKYWLPSTLSWYCIPRTAGLTETCENGTSWPSSAVRCAPRCDGQTLVSETFCANYDGDNFCTFQCDPLGEACGFTEPIFAGGCCENFMGSDWCTPAEHCP